ncbi:hypothetical protein [Simiduia litorea]|uniref:hypothetical protein n=1 Tax=Simiduia litorea TaxID=1435348 RepID=UPI0036F1A0BE
MKKLGFLLLALAAPVTLANPQSSITTSVVAAGVDTSWTTENVDKNANTTQLKALNRATLSLGQSINTDLDEKISQRLRDQAEVQ